MMCSGKERNWLHEIEVALRISIACLRALFGYRKIKKMSPQEVSTTDSCGCLLDEVQAFDLLILENDSGLDQV